MLVGRLSMETTDVRRATVDFTAWLDDAETIAGFSAPIITLLATFDPNYYAVGQPAVIPMVDLTPLELVGSFLIGGDMVQLFLEAGTPGYAYQVQFVATGTSTRQQTIELIVMIKAAPNVVI